MDYHVINEKKFNMVVFYFFFLSYGINWNLLYNVEEKMLTVESELSTTVPGDMRERGSQMKVGKRKRYRKWQPAPVVLPGKSHGQRSLVGYNPWGRKEPT